MALKLTLYSGNTLLRGGAAIGGANNVDFAPDILGLLWSQAGVRIPEDLDSKAAADALTFYTNFMKEDKVWNNDMPEAATAFVNEKVSMLFAPSWVLESILQAKPDMNIGVAPVPQALPDKPVSWGSFWMASVPVTSKNQTAAWDFINFLAQEDQELSLYSDASQVRKFGAPYARTGLASQLSTNKYVKPYLDIAPFAKSGVIAARAGNKTAVDTLVTAINDVLGGKSAEEALKKMLGK